MLIEFRCSNHKSIREEILFSMLAGADSAHGEQILPAEDLRLLHTAVIYGANGSGKAICWMPWSSFAPGSWACALCAKRPTNWQQERPAVISSSSFGKKYAMSSPARCVGKRSSRSLSSLSPVGVAPPFIPAPRKDFMYAAASATSLPKPTSPPLPCWHLLQRPSPPLPHFAAFSGNVLSPTI